MVQAYILVQTEVGKSAAVAREITGIGGVVSAEDVTGPYDVIVKVEAPTVDDLGQLISRIQEVPHITRTTTCTVIRL
jgi:DNA-binding Lrp family transcriptional regulator